jgi:hypothetical protein
MEMLQNLGWRGQKCLLHDAPAQGSSEEEWVKNMHGKSDVLKSSYDQGEAKVKNRMQSVPREGQDSKLIAKQNINPTASRGDPTSSTLSFFIVST